MSCTILNQNFNSIVECYGDMITRICIINLHNIDDAKDCFQNIFIKLFQSDISFHNEEHLKAWLIRVTINECKNYHKMFHRKTINVDEVVIATTDYKFTLLPEVLKLPTKYKNVLYLYYYEGYKINEITTLLNYKENTVKSHLKRGRELLKERLGDFYE